MSLVQYMRGTNVQNAGVPNVVSTKRGVTRRGVTKRGRGLTWIHGVHPSQVRARTLHTRTDWSIVRICPRFLRLIGPS
eukprot:56952-Prorocentrum_minimum.AAC.1